MIKRIKTHLPIHEKNQLNFILKFRFQNLKVEEFPVRKLDSSALLSAKEVPANAFQEVTSTNVTAGKIQIKFEITLDNFDFPPLRESIN